MLNYSINVSAIYHCSADLGVNIFRCFSAATKSWLFGGKYSSDGIQRDVSSCRVGATNRAHIGKSKLIKI